jgi:hypothetical protein
VSAAAALEGRYRRLLAWYPAEHRRAYGEEMIGVLLAAARDGQRRPGAGDTADLIRGGLLARTRAAMSRFRDINWSDALAVCSVAIPILFLVYNAGINVGLLAIWAAPTWMVPIVAVRFLVLLVFAVPPLLALRYRRAARLVALALAGLYTIFLLLSTPVGSQSNSGQVLVNLWHVLANSGELLATLLALWLGGAALAWSPGPRRAIEILTWRSWLVLIGSGATMSLVYYLPRLASGPWAIIAVVVAVLAATATGLSLTIPGPVVRGVLLLLAIPAYPGVVWATELGLAPSGAPGFAGLVLLPTAAFAGLAVTAARRSRRTGPT